MQLSPAVSQLPDKFVNIKCKILIQLICSKLQRPSGISLSVVFCQYIINFDLLKNIKKGNLLNLNLF